MRSRIPPILAGILIGIILVTAPPAFVPSGRPNVTAALTVLSFALALVVGVCIYRRAYRFLAIFVAGVFGYVFLVAASIVWIGVRTQWW